MGCFGYICPVCKTSIRGNCSAGGEHCVLIHKRHGEEVGRVVGHYNEYGGVVENEYYRGDEHTYANGKPNKNSHDEICDSEMRLLDSNAFGRKFILPDGTIYDRDTYSVGIEYFENMLQEFPTFSENFTPELEKTVERFREIKSMWFSRFRTKETLTPEEREQIDAYIKATMRMPEDLQAYFNNWIENLSPVIPQSGTVAVHKKCYDSLTPKQRKELPISKDDPDQSWGKVRKKYS